MTQEQFAEKLGVIRENYAKIEQGRVNMTMATVGRIARGLRVPLVELFVPPELKRAPKGRPRKNVLTGARPRTRRR